MPQSPKQMLAQAGVVFFILWFTAFVWGPFVVQYWLPLYLASWAWMPMFVIAAVLPDRERDAWGCMWPLVGYDNVIDAIYTRGPWWKRFQELEDLEEERRITEGMITMFDAA